MDTKIDKMIFDLQFIVKRRVSKKKDRPDKAAKIESIKENFKNQTVPVKGYAAVALWKNHGSHSQQRFYDALDQIIKHRLTDPVSQDAIMNSDRCFEYITNVLKERAPAVENLFIEALRKAEVYRHVTTKYGSYLRIADNMLDYIRQTIKKGDTWPEIENMMEDIKILWSETFTKEKYEKLVVSHAAQIGDENKARRFVKYKLITEGKERSSRKIEFFITAYAEFVKASRSFIEYRRSIEESLLSLLNFVEQLDIKDPDFITVLSDNTDESTIKVWQRVKKVMLSVTEILCELMDCLHVIYDKDEPLPEQIHNAVVRSAFQYFKNVTTYINNSSEEPTIKFVNPRACTNDGWAVYFSNKRKWVFPELTELVTQNFEESFLGYLFFICNCHMSEETVERFTEEQEETIARWMKNNLQFAFNSNLNNSFGNTLPPFWTNLIHKYVNTIALDRVIPFERMILEFKDDNAWESYLESLKKVKQNGWVLTK
jgi:hypothetical protein